jgi:hypothetical protein
MMRRCLHYVRAAETGMGCCTLSSRHPFPLKPRLMHGADEQEKQVQKSQVATISQHKH